MKRAVITGATGAVGTALLQELIENNVEILVLCREGSKPDPMKYQSTSSRFDSLLNSFEINDRILYRDVDLEKFCLTI